MNINIENNTFENSKYYLGFLNKNQIISFVIIIYIFAIMSRPHILINRTQQYSRNTNSRNLNSISSILQNISNSTSNSDMMFER